MGLLLEAPEHVVRPIRPCDFVNPLRVVDVILVPEAWLGGERRDRPDDDCGLELEEAPVPVAAERGVPVEADHAAVVGVQVLPAASTRFDETPWPAARQPVVEITGVDVHAEPGPPEILEFPVRVEIAAQLQPVAVEVE